jgi:deazaflavin-dependent oxidoreductase (nitroreductase family)
MQDMQAFNRALIEEFRANGGKQSGQLANSTLMLLTTVGAKSGAERVTPLGFVKDDARLIVIAANAGAPTHPDWYYNLLAHPEVTIEIGNERFVARATVADEVERTRLIALIPYFNAQQEKTSRVIPVVIFTPNRGDGA